MTFHDKFETVFHNGTLSDKLEKICDEVFVNSFDSYVDKMMTYSTTNHPLWMKFGFLSQSGMRGDRRLSSSTIRLATNVT